LQVLIKDEASGHRAAIALLAVSVFVILLYRYWREGRSDSASVRPSIVAEVQGDVTRPGIYLIKNTRATVADLLNVAGGLRSGLGSRIDERHLTKEVRTGQLLRIRSAPDGVQLDWEPMAAAARLALGQKLDLNVSSEVELCLVPQMKPELARSIVVMRGERPWRSVEDLVQLPGVGPKTAEKWGKYLEVNER
jgi:competence protein ComEA